MEVICLQEAAFYKLVDKVVSHVEANREERKWVDGEEAMSLLNISSKTTLQKFRDEGRIRYSQPEKKILLYDRNSINEFLEKNAQETF